MKYRGISSGFHDAAVAFVSNNQITFASHSERLSRIKNDKHLDPKLAQCHSFEKTVFYEDVALKNQRREKFNMAPVKVPEYPFVKHHQSHMAAGYFTCPFDTKDAVCVVIDAIGEWDTVTIWKDGVKVYSRQYPYSLGLFYSAITKRIGLKPNEDEYITMGMAAFGEPVLDLKWVWYPHYNWHKGFKVEDFKGVHPYDIAASAQAELENELMRIMQIAKQYGKDLIYGGGVALNCVANAKIRNMFRNMWIFPNPGDAGSSLGAILCETRQHIDFKDCFLGYLIDNRLNPREVVDHLLKHKVVGVANGRAEFGPRALGNRSLLADPRYSVKGTVNRIKRRQQFRPFAPAILAEYFNDYFYGEANEYMQYTTVAKHDYSSVIHVDGTSRTQIVRPSNNSRLRLILEEFYERTGCPMLLNTSLNIKGQPMVNTWEDALEFEKKYGVKVF